MWLEKVPKPTGYEIPFIAVSQLAGRSLSEDLLTSKERIFRTPDFDLQYVLRGEGSLSVKGQVYPCREGDLFLLQPQETFEVKFQPHILFDRFFIHFSPRAIEGVDFTSSKLLAFRHLSVGHLPEIQVLVSNLIFERYQLDPGKAVSDLKLTELLLRLGHLNEGRLVSPLSEAYQHRLEKIRVLLSRDFKAEYPLTLLAKEAGLSVNHFSKLFKQYTERTPYQFRLEAKLNQARILIHLGESMKEVALQCGFADSQHFSNAFRKHFGKAPSQMALKWGFSQGQRDFWQVLNEF